MRQQNEVYQIQSKRKSKFLAQLNKERKEKEMAEKKQEAKMQEEMKKRSSGYKDLLDENYFADKSRFNRTDYRDPLYHDFKDSGDKDYWKSYFSTSYSQAKVTIEKMKESEPLTFHETTMSRGRIGYKTHRVGKYALLSIASISVSLAVFELWSEYQENQQDAASFRSLLIKNKWYITNKVWGKD